MTYRSDVDSETFVTNSRVLASETLAYSLATPEQQTLLTNIFESVARWIEKLVPETADQHRFGRTLLGIDHSLEIDAWVKDNAQVLEKVDSAEDLFEIIWPLLTDLSSEKRLVDTVPEGAMKVLAASWLTGRPFAELMQELDVLGASYPYGRYSRSFDIDLVVDLCEQTFGFEFALLLATVKESFIAYAKEEAGEEFKGYADLLQKRLKYGLPNQECIAYFEAGFAERVIAQAFSDEMIWETAKTSYDARKLARKYPDDFEAVLRDFPSYFTDVFRTITAP